jgi:hypothetical protein
MPSPAQPASLNAARFLNRARLYRAQAMLLSDQENSQPNWPKFFLMTHATELAINAYLIFREGLGLPADEGLRRHDLMGHYNAAVKHGLKDNALVREYLPFPSELHRIHYERYPKIESRPVPAYISQYDDMLDQLLADVRHALGPVSDVGGA